VRIYKIKLDGVSLFSLSVSNDATKSNFTSLFLLQHNERRKGGEIMREPNAKSFNVANQGFISVCVK
jgi:hypothetical protein